MTKEKNHSAPIEEQPAINKHSHYWSHGKYWFLPSACKANEVKQGRTCVCKNGFEKVGNSCLPKVSKYNIVYRLHLNNFWYSWKKNIYLCYCPSYLWKLKCEHYVC